MHPLALDHNSNSILLTSHSTQELHTVTIKLNPSKGATRGPWPSLCGLPRQGVQGLKRLLYEAQFCYIETSKILMGYSPSYTDIPSLINAFGHLLRLTHVYDRPSPLLSAPQKNTTTTQRQSLQRECMKSEDTPEESPEVVLMPWDGMEEEIGALDGNLNVHDDQTLTLDSLLKSPLAPAV